MESLVDARFAASPLTNRTKNGIGFSGVAHFAASIRHRDSETAVSPHEREARLIQLTVLFIPACDDLRTSERREGSKNRCEILPLKCRFAAAVGPTMRAMPRECRDTRSFIVVMNASTFSSVHELPRDCNQLF
jgi:hypothetical protein